MHRVESGKKVRCSFEGKLRADEFRLHQPCGIEKFEFSGSESRFWARLSANQLRKTFKSHSWTSFLGNYVIQAPRITSGASRSRGEEFSRDGSDRRNSFRRSHLIADPTYWSIQWGIRWIIIVDFPSRWISCTSFPTEDTTSRYPVTCDLFDFFFFFFFVDANTIARTRRRRARADPARCHPIERSRRTEPNAVRSAPSCSSTLLAAERDRTVTSPIGALDSVFYVPIRISFHYFRNMRYLRGIQLLSNLPKSVAYSANQTDGHSPSRISDRDQKSNKSVRLLLLLFYFIFYIFPNRNRILHILVSFLIVSNNIPVSIIK